MAKNDRKWALNITEEEYRTLFVRLHPFADCMPDQKEYIKGIGKESKNRSISGVREKDYETEIEGKKAVDFKPSVPLIEVKYGKINLPTTNK